MAMTGKQKAFADVILRDPKTTLKAAAKEAYGVDGNLAEVMGYENIRKPQIMQYLQKHATKAEMVLINAMNATKKVYKFNPETKTNEFMEEVDDHLIRLKAADSILDRVHGKAKQSVEVTQTTLNVSIDLSGNSTTSDD